MLVGLPALRRAFRALSIGLSTDSRNLHTPSKTENAQHLFTGATRLALNGRDLVVRFQQEFIDHVCRFLGTGNDKKMPVVDQLQPGSGDQLVQQFGIGHRD